jgi:hypothetical protein
MSVSVISRQHWNRWTMAWRYAGAESRGRLGRQCWATDPSAERHRCDGRRQRVRTRTALGLASCLVGLASGRVPCDKTLATGR